MMRIWYCMDFNNNKYFKFILFNSGAVKIVSNDEVGENNSREPQYISFFKDGSNFLDGIMTIFKLDFLDLTELTQWINEEYKEKKF